jgi:hypothetical protein
MNRTLKQSFLKGGSKCRLDVAVNCLYTTVCDYYQDRCIVSEQRPPGLAKNKRMKCYEKRVIRARELVNKPRHAIKILDTELSIAVVRCSRLADPCIKTD